MMSRGSGNKPTHALFNAVSTSKLRLVRLLIEGGVHVDTRNDRGQTPLLNTCSSLNKACHARGETRESVVKYLISAGADVNAHDVTGRTPLIYAVIMRAQSSVIFDLIEAGAHLWSEDNSHKCAFDYALKQENIAQVEVIVDAYKRRKLRGITRGTSPSSIHLHFDADTTSIHQKKKSSSKNKSKHDSGKKPKVYPTNRKRSSRHAPTNISSRNPKHLNLLQNDHSNHSSDKNRNLVTSASLNQRFSQYICDERESVNTPPTKSNSPKIHQNTQLCYLCKSIFSEDHHTDNNHILDPPKTSPRNLATVENPDLCRRRSTGSLLGLMKKQYDAIRKKRELGTSMDDLFSSSESNKSGEQAQTNTLLDISSNELVIPGSNRGRSKSVSLPPLEDATRMLGEHLNMFCSRNENMGFSDDEVFLTSARSVPRLHSPDLYYQGSDDELEDLLYIPSQFRSTTSSPDGDNWSQRDLMSPQIEQRSSSCFGKEDNLSACSSPIPMIVLTDYVDSDED